MEDMMPKIICYGVSTVTDHLLVVIKSAADQMSRLLGEETNLSFHLHNDKGDLITMGGMSWEKVKPHSLEKARWWIFSTIFQRMRRM